MTKETVVAGFVGWLALLASAPANAELNCWVPMRDQTQARYASMALTSMRNAVLQAERVVRDRASTKT